MLAVLWTTVTDGGRGERPFLRTFYGVQDMPCLLRHGRPSRIAAAVKDRLFAHPLWCREYAMPTVPWTTVTDSGT
eukprot:5245914-Pyramimonas_sp.AAC.1